MNWTSEPVTVRVPATSANLGPGFDSLGLAIAVHDVVEAEVTSGGLSIEVRGAGGDTAALAEGHLVVRAMRAAFAVLGGQPPGLRLRCQNVIPQGYGLGSSAAAIVAGLLAARALASADGPGRLPDGAVLDLAARLEGHPDNVAACLAGGLTIAWTGSGRTRSVRLPVDASVTPVLCVPRRPLPTAAARTALPPAVPHADAAANAARSALLISALTGVTGALLDATEDFIHQRYRAAAMPASAGLIAALRAAGVPAVLSGAGPAVLAFTAPGLPPVAAVAGCAASQAAGWAVSAREVDASGAAVRTGVAS